MTINFVNLLLLCVCFWQKSVSPGTVKTKMKNSAMIEKLQVRTPRKLYRFYFVLVKFKQLLLLSSHTFV